MPTGTCFLSFLRKTFFFPVVFAITLSLVSGQWSVVSSNRGLLLTTDNGQLTNTISSLVPSSWRWSRAVVLYESERLCGSAVHGRVTSAGAATLGNIRCPSIV